MRFKKFFQFLIFNFAYQVRALSYVQVSDGNRYLRVVLVDKRERLFISVWYDQKGNLSKLLLSVRSLLITELFITDLSTYELDTIF